MVGTCVLTLMASIHIQQTVRNITSVPMEPPMSMPVLQAFFGMIPQKIVILLKMSNAPQGQLYPHLQHQQYHPQLLLLKQPFLPQQVLHHLRKYSVKKSLFFQAL